MTKPGYKTTEFWIQFVPFIMAALTLYDPSLSKGIADIATAVAAGAYAHGRSTVKANAVGGTSDNS